MCGSILDLSKPVCLHASSCFHQTEPWEGDRVVIVVFTKQLCYRYCNDTVSATGGSLAAGSESLPMHGDLSGDRTPPTSSQTIVGAYVADRCSAGCSGLLSRQTAPRWWRRQSGRRLCRRLRLLPNKADLWRLSRSPIALQVFCWFSKANPRRPLLVL